MAKAAAKSKITFGKYSYSMKTCNKLIRTEVGGKEIWECTLRGLRGKEYAQTILNITTEIVRNNEKDINFLLEIENNYIDEEVFGTYTLCATVIRVYCARIAILGANMMQRIHLAAVNLYSDVEAVPFDSKKDALKWLGGVDVQFTLDDILRRCYVLRENIAELGKSQNEREERMLREAEELNKE